MLGTLVNTFAVIIGASIGLLIKKGIPERIGDSLMKGLGLCSLYIGISGAFKGENTLIMIISIVHSLKCWMFFLRMTLMES